MREFRCDDELVKILEKFGFKDFTPKADTDRGKRTFRKSKGSERFIKFDYINFIFWSGLGAGDTIHNTAVTEIELKSIFWYMGCATADKYFITGDAFSVKSCQETYRQLKRAYDFYTIEYPKPGKNLKRIKRLLDSYDNISLA